MESYLGSGGRQDGLLAANVLILFRQQHVQPGLAEKRGIGDTVEPRACDNCIVLIRGYPVTPPTSTISASPVTKEES